MNRFIKFILVLSADYFCFISASGQTAIPASGGTANGSGGTSTYTVGQVFYFTIPGTSVSIAQGVQQPWEISVVTAIENTEGITLGMKVYPNPDTIGGERRTEYPRRGTSSAQPKSTYSRQLPGRGI